MFERILVALDTSPHNQSVFDTALSLAKLTQARLLLAHILPAPEMNLANLRSIADCAEHPTPYDEMPLTPNQRRHWEEQGLEMLRSFYQVAKDRGIGADLAQPLANPGDKLCKLAIDWGADLIVTGRRGLTEQDETVMISVSSHVIHHSPCPVLVVQHEPCSTKRATQDGRMASSHPG